MHHLKAPFFCQSNPFASILSKLPAKALQFLLVILLASAPLHLFAAPPVASSISLAATSANTAVTTLHTGSLLTLTASATSNGASITTGQVIFCDTAVSTFCSDTHHFGSAQLTSAGTAAISFFPAPGTHAFIAQFAGTTTDATSTSSSLAFTVTAANTTQTTLTSSPTPNQSTYLFSSSVLSNGGSTSPTGTVSLIDTTSNNLALGQAQLAPAAASLTLTNSSNPATGQEPTSIAIGDFNGDGIPDLAVPNPGVPGGYGAGPMTILLGKGDGTFIKAASPSTTTFPSVAIAGDFNGDGKEDLAVDGNINGSLQILLGNGDGTFTPLSSNPFWPGIGAIATGDFNHDGKADIAVISYSSGNGTQGTTPNLFVIFGNGDGTFNNSFKPTLPAQPSELAVGDFNGDGIPDLAVSSGNYPNPSTISILLSDGAGHFTTQPNPQIVNGFIASYSPQLVVGDFNGDGKADLVVSYEPYTSADNFLVDVFYGNGDGSLATASQITTGSANSFGMAVGDFNGDGISDLATADDVATHILLGSTSGSFTLAATAPGATTGPDVDTLAIADFNGDGIPDLAQADSDNNAITVYLSSLSTTSSASFANLAIPGSGTHNITAVYSGDSSFASSTSSPVAVNASSVPTTLTLTSSASTLTAGSQAVLTATLAPYSDSTLTTNGEQITFLSGATSLGTATLSSGVAVLNTTTIPVGSDSLTATYSGDTYFAPAASVAIPVTVALPGPAATLTPGSLTFASQSVGTTSTAQMVTLTNSGQAPLTINASTVSGPFPQTNNCASSLAAGQSCTFAVTFAPTATGSTSGTLTLTDNAPGSPQTVALSGAGAGLAVASSVPSLSIASTGGSATATLQISGVNGFSGTVNLTCAVTYQGQGTASEPPTCSLNPAQAQLAVGATLSSTLTVSTTAATSSSSPAHELPWNRSGIAFAALVFLGLLPRRHRRGTLLFALLGLAILGGAIGCSGSGSSSNSSGNNTPSNPGTTAGAYTVTVTATSGSTTIATPFNLTLQ